MIVTLDVATGVVLLGAAMADVAHAMLTASNNAEVTFRDFISIHVDGAAFRSQGDTLHHAT
jgi:hypothetical protein